YLLDSPRCPIGALHAMRAAQRPVIFSSFAGNRAPSTVIFEAALSISRRSSIADVAVETKFEVVQVYRLVCFPKNEARRIVTLYQAQKPWQDKACTNAVKLIPTGAKASFTASQLGVKVVIQFVSAIFGVNVLVLVEIAQQA